MAQQPTEQRKPWVLCFVTKRERDKKARGGIMLTIEAMAEDGTVLHKLETDDLVQAKAAIGVTEAHMDDLYKKHYPQGFRIDWVDPSRTPRDKTEGHLQDLLLKAIAKSEAKAAKDGDPTQKTDAKQEQAGKAESEKPDTNEKKQEEKKKEPEKPKIPANAPREKQIVRDLNVKIPPAELPGIAREWNDVLEEAEALEIELDRTKKAIQGQIADLAKRASELRREIRTGERRGEVACLVKYDWDKNRKLVIRQDTQEEVGTEPIEWHERQECLNLGGDRGEEKGLKPQGKPRKGKRGKPGQDVGQAGDPGQEVAERAPQTLVCEVPDAEVEAMADGRFRKIAWQDLTPGTVFRATHHNGEDIWPDVGRRFRVAGRVGPAGTTGGWFVEADVVPPPEPGNLGSGTKQAENGTPKAGNEPLGRKNGTKQAKKELREIKPRDPAKVVRLANDQNFAVHAKAGEAYPEKDFADLTPGDVIRFVNRETGEIAGGKDWRVLSAPVSNMGNQLEIKMEAA